MLHHETPKTITIYASSGLANRLRPIWTAHRLCQHTGRTLRVHWASRRAVDPLEHPSLSVPYPATWDDLFQPIPAAPVPESEATAFLGGVPSHYDQYWWHTHTVPRDEQAQDIAFYTFRCLTFADEPLIDYHNNVFRPFAPEILTPRQQLILTELRVMRPEPATDLAAAILDFKNRHFTGRVLSVHVRRMHSYCRTIGLERFYKAIDAADYDVLFLATDCEQTESIFSQRYPQLISYKHSYDPGTLEATREAIIDLYLIAAAQQIIGTACSTYSEAATMLSDHYNYQFITATD